MRAWALAALAAVCSTAVGAQTPPVPLPSATLPAALDRVLRDYEAGWKAKDGKALARLFTEDGFVLSANRAPIRGRAAIERQYSATAGGELKLRALGFAAADTVGYIVGSYTYPPHLGDVGKFVLALRKGFDGHWLIAADIDNSNETPR